MKVEYLKAFAKDIAKLKDGKLKQRLVEVINEVKAAKDIREINELKKLKGFNSAYRIKVGEYRLGVFIENQTIQFARFLHRKEVYNRFP
jgi:mRNA interferase RelE/StbE